MEIIPFDDYNHRLHPGTDFVGSVLPTWGNHALTNGWKLLESDMSKIYRIKSIELLGREIPKGTSGGTGYDEYADLLVNYDNGEKQKVRVGCYYQDANLVFKQLFDAVLGCENPEEAYNYLWGAISDFVWPADFNDLPADYRVPKKCESNSRKIYRIRKLTPLECHRLMGVKDEDFYKMKNAGISDSQLYKLAGNSIVVDVLEAIFRNINFTEKPLQVFEAFAGYGSQSMALRNIGIEHEVVGISEIDKYAIMAYNATHEPTTNYGDISKIDWGAVPNFDFFTYSFPCTDISNAGAQAGFEEGSGTRSSLLWECRKAIIEKRPKYLMMENVKAITSKKFLPGLHRWQEFLSEQGYTNFVKVLNAKDYGVPQNRERCFIVSILGDAWYDFPEPRPLEVKLKDLLEEKVDEKYYLDQERVNTFIEGLSDEKRAALEEGRTV